MACSDQTVFGRETIIWNIRGQKKYLNIEKIAFEVVQIKFLMHITHQKLSLDIFTVGNLQYLHGT